MTPFYVDESVMLYHGDCRGLSTTALQQNPHGEMVKTMRYTVIWIAWFLGRIGYMIRPYDMLADRRRWFWQPRIRCYRFAMTTRCCGDPTNRDGGAHPWRYIGKDRLGMHYRCPDCGALDSD